MGLSRHRREHAAHLVAGGFHTHFRSRHFEHFVECHSADGFDLPHQRPCVVPRAPLGHDDVLATAQFCSCADRVFLAEDFRSGRVERFDDRLAVTGNLVSRFSNHLFVHGHQLVGTEPNLPGTAEVKRHAIACEGVAGNDRAGRGVAVGLGPDLFCKVRIVTAPEVNPALVGHEHIVKDQVVAPMINVHAATFQSVALLAVALEKVAGDQGRARVARPNTADRVAYDAIAQVLVAEGERVLDPVRGGIREIVSNQQIVGIATALVPFNRMLASFPDGLTAGETEETVATVCHGVFGKDILIILLEGKNARRVLAAVVHIVTVTAHAEIKGVAADDIPGAPPQGDSPAGVEREIIVIDFGRGDAVKAQRILAMPDPRVAHGHPGGLFHINRRAVIREPLMLVVIVAVEPVTGVFCPRRGFQPRPPVV